MVGIIKGLLGAGGQAEQEGEEGGQTEEEGFVFHGWFGRQPFGIEAT